MIESNPDFYITYASDFNSAAPILADEARYNGNSGKTAYVILMPEGESRSERRAGDIDQLKKTEAVRMHDGESVVALKIGNAGRNLIVGTALMRIREGKKSFKVFVNSRMPGSNQLANELNAIFNAMKAPKGFDVRVVNPKENGFETTDLEIASAEVIQLDFQQ